MESCLCIHWKRWNDKILSFVTENSEPLISIKSVWHEWWNSSLPMVPGLKMTKWDRLLDPGRGQGPLMISAHWKKKKTHWKRGQWNISILLASIYIQVFCCCTISWLQLYLYLYSLMHNLHYSAKYLSNCHSTSCILWLSIVERSKTAFHFLSVTSSQSFSFIFSLSAVCSLISFKEAYRTLIYF